MKLFERKDTRTHTSQVAQQLEEEVSRISDANISSCEIQEWIDYLVGKYSISPVILFEEAISQKLEEVKVKRYNHWYRQMPFEKEYFEVDGYQITFSIPFDGDDNIFFLQPSSRLLTSFDVADLNAPRGESLGNVSLCFQYTRQELLDKAENMQQFVQTQFENEFRNYRTMLGYVNSEIRAFNQSLPEFAKKCLTERKSKADATLLISKSLEIPLRRSEAAPNSSPIALKRVVRSSAKPPQQKPIQAEYSIGDWDYQNINNIILMAGTTMEKTARTYIKNNEEELRDHLLASLNTHYSNATGETFRKIGKTDIHIEFENKAAFIGECKIWHGEKLFAEAVQQLMNYSTWKDIKVSVIIFNKENQSFVGVLAKIDSWINANTKKSVRKKPNLWECDYYRTDMGVLVKMNIIVFDLYVDKTQIQDKRA